MNGKRTKGLTLIEVVMSIAIVGIISAGCVLYIRQVMDLWEFTSFRSEVASPARIVLSRMAREIRQVSNTASVYFANGTKFQFNDISNNNITYFLSNKSVMRNNDSLIDGVSAFNFTYYNLTNQPIANPLVAPLATNIRRIGIKFNVVSGSLNKTMETQVWPRNFGG